MLQRFYTPERNNIVMLGQGRPQAQGKVIASPATASSGRVIASPATASSGRVIASPATARPGQGRPHIQGDRKGRPYHTTGRPAKAVYSPRLWVLALHQGHLHPRLYYIRVNMRQSFVEERPKASGLLKSCWPTDSEICLGQNAAQGMHYFRDYSILSCWIPEA